MADYHTANRQAGGHSHSGGWLGLIIAAGAFLVCLSLFASALTGSGSGLFYG